MRNNTTDVIYKIEIYTMTTAGHILFDTLHCNDYIVDNEPNYLVVDDNIIYRLGSDCIVKIIKLNK